MLVYRFVFANDAKKFARDVRNLYYVATRHGRDVTVKSDETAELRELAEKYYGRSVPPNEAQPWPKQ